VTRTAPLATLATAGLAMGLVTAACVRPDPRNAGTSDDLGRPAPPVGPPPSRTATPAGPTQPAVASPQPNAAPTASSARSPYQRGKATYYADSLAGHSTASGEPYDPKELTAAHRELPFGSVVDVVRNDGRWVRVRITDRGPFAKGRIIDLSRRAAETLGMLQAGVVDVALYVVSRPSPR
jgi:rare lipoprotein A